MMFMNSGSDSLFWGSAAPRRRGAVLSFLLGVLVVGMSLDAGLFSLCAQPAVARVDPPTARAPLGPSSSVIFCIDTAGAPVLRYQWQKNGVQLPGETNQCLVLTNIGINDGASYRATVADATGAIESEEGTLMVLVNILSGADFFGSGTSIGIPSNSVRGVSVGATRDPGEPTHFGLSTSNSIWYSWRAPDTGIVTFDTRGSTYDTVLAVYTGSDLPGVRPVVSDDDSGGFHASRVSWNAVGGTVYRVVIDGVTGETGGYVCNWNLEATGEQLPVITLQPRSQAVREGETAVFHTAATNYLPGLKFQWFRNGQPIPDATQSNLTIAKVSNADLGRYQLAITNDVLRSVRTIPVDLEIGPEKDVVSRDKIAEIQLPAGGESGRPGGAAGDEKLFAPSSVSGGTFSLSSGTIINQRFFNGGTADRCEPAHCNVAGGSSRWFQLSAMTDGICTIDTANSDVDTVLAVYLQNFSICTNLFEPLVDCNNDIIGSCDQIVAATAARERGSRVSFFAPAGTVYRAVVDTAGGVRGTNLQFNIRFEASAMMPTNRVLVGTATNAILQMRGSSVTLQVQPSLTAPGMTYQWYYNAQRIAGATRDRLLLSRLNYGDAGVYWVLLQLGTSRTVLPGISVLVMDPCRRDGAAHGPVRVVGASTAPVLLEATSDLSATSSWQVIGPFPSSLEPRLWETNGGNQRFYRMLRPPP
jgi:hypothetical protein